MTTRTIYIVPAPRQHTTLSSPGSTSSARQITIGRHVPVAVRQSPIAVSASATSHPTVVHNATILQPVSTRHTIALAQKRPASTLDDASTEVSSLDDLLGLSTSDTHPVRKRERLTHLTAEEKLNRRKLKNRVAAQTARDRKKIRTSKLEEAVRKLIDENKALREENIRINAICDELKQRNAELEKSLKEHEEGDSSGTSPCIKQSSLGSAASIRGPQQREQAIATMPAIDLQEILDDLFEDDPELEQFCSKMLDGDEELPQEDGASTSFTPSLTLSTTQVGGTTRVDSPSSHIYLAPEYLQPKSDLQSSSCKEQRSPSDTSGSAESPSYASENNSDKCIPLVALSPSQQVPSPGTTAVYETNICSPLAGEQLCFDEMKLEHEQSPFIGNDDPVLGAPLLWDDFTMVGDTFELSTDF
ncbi:X-box-binding protein 1 [Toxocara canis]|uniref:X-box-binding protein 1 n=1 Tax=Toxocara canis TaxID=6265 RepID=A0A0B2VDW0_TOXCA|nr:X-box-binding protein 1 [Toxocara canis]